MRAPIGHLDTALPAPDALAELPPPVADAVRDRSGSAPADRLVHADTGPQRADPAVFVEHHGRELPEQSANCVVVQVRRDRTRHQRAIHGQYSAVTPLLAHVSRRVRGGG